MKNDLSNTVTAPVIELPDSVRIPLHSLQADLEYLIGRVIADSSRGSMVVKSMRDRLNQIEEAVHSISERIDATRAALRTALGQWRMYAEMYETGGGIERDFDIEKEKSPEADMYRRCKAALSVDVVSGATEGGNG